MLNNELKYFQSKKGVNKMLTEKGLLKVGEIYRKAFFRDECIPVRVEEVAEGGKDAIVRIGRYNVIAVSEIEGKMHPYLGKKAEFIDHGKWIITRDSGSKCKVTLLNKSCSKIR